MAGFLSRVVAIGGILLAGMDFGQDADKAGDPHGILLKPIPEKMVVLTFDDSCVSHATFVGPLLKELGFGATFYITEAFKDKTKYMSWEQIKKLEELGFEIGNHSTNHGVCGNQSVDECTKQLMGLEEHCVANKISKPTTYCYPVYLPNKGFFPVLQEKGYLFARGGGERAYVPTTDNPLNAPSFTVHDGTLKKKDSWTNALKQATAGHFVIFCFHGAPDLEHPWVNTDPARFKEMMQHLKDNQYTVIAMRDMAKYVDAAKAAKQFAK